MSYRSFLLACCLVGSGAGARVAAADAPAGSIVQEAGKHFSRGVSLYQEADYRAALVEFRRAYEIAPNTAVLYNIGETYYQLQNYAQAMTTLERYLTEAGAGAPHSDEVDKTLDILRARVGKIEVTTNLPDTEITVDDELVGKAPLKEPVLVSIGRRKITAMHSGRQPETRFIEVAAGDTAKLTLDLADPEGAARPIGPAAPSNLPTVGWIATGAFAVGSVTMGILAYRASNQLKDARNTFGVTHDDLTSKANKVSTYAAIADGLGAAAIVTGVLTFTLSRSRTHEVKVGVVPGRILIGGTFP
jgi:tetratricopeptide (TPR) repeat protein